MIIYDKHGLENLHLQEEAENVRGAGLVTEPELKSIKEKYPTGFYTPTLVFRIGFFILTLVGSLFTGLLLSLLFEGTHLIDHPIWPLLLGSCTYIALEAFTKSNRLFRSGLDDCLLWLTAALLTGGFTWAVSDNNNKYMLVSGFILLLSFYFTLRFADAMMSVVACLSLLAFVFFTWSKIGSFGTATMPFVIMLFSYFIFYVSTQIKKDYRSINYQNCLLFAQIISLLMLYAAGNYFVVQKLGNQLHHLPQESNTPLPLGWFFWIWTMLLPLLYAGLGIKKRSLLLLRLGLLLMVAAVYTFRNYYHLLPIEYALVIAGSVSLLIVFWVIKYLKTPKNGFTYAERNSKHWANNVHLESLLVSGTASHTPAAPVKSDNRFGGGSFGGGGSSSDF